MQLTTYEVDVQVKKKELLGKH